MNKSTLIWTLIAALPVGAGALGTAYVYRDTGRLPFQEAVAPAADPAGEDVGGQTASGVDSGPAVEATVEADAPAETAGAAPAEVTRKGPSYDVVSVEPTGETVVAGRSDAGAIVALTANGKVVGKSIANEAGEWTIILDEPLKPGDYDVGLEVHDEAGTPVSTSEERLVVSLPEGGKDKPLVVLNAPDGPSDILQKPDTAPETVARTDPQEAPDTEVAATGGASQDETQTQTQAPAETTEPQVAAADPSGQSATDTPEAAPEVAQADGGKTPAPGASDTETAAAQADTGSGPETTVAALAPSTDAGEDAGAPDAQPGTEAADAAAEDPAKPAETDSASLSDTPDTASSAVADAQPETAPGDAPEAEEQTAAAPTQDTAVPAAPADEGEPVITVEAVESEKDKVYVAGTGKPGSSVRVYVGDEFQGQADVNASGRWLVQGSKAIAEGNVEVRADMIATDGDTVDARAAVTFEKEEDSQIVLTKVVATGASSGEGAEGAEVRKALPVVIIRKGDNLWRISRRLYGEGLRYTTIYQANQKQIRNPDLIYPGQVFLTPEGDLNWKAPPETNG